MVPARKDVDRRVVGQAEKILAVNRLRIDFLEAATPGRDESELGIEGTLLPGGRFEQRVGEAARTDTTRLIIRRLIPIS